jgi:glycosyltransferase involved in cell wall biosynthesis
LVRITTVPISLDKLLTGQLRYMHDHDFDVCMISSWNEELPLIAERESSGYLAINMIRTISPLNDLVSLFKLIKAFRKLKPTIVHTHTPKAGFLGMLASWFIRVPIRLHTVAGLPLMEAKGFNRIILEKVEWLTYFCASKVYPNSSNLSRFIIESKLSKPGKLKVIGNGSSNGINTDNFKMTPAISSQADVLKQEYSIIADSFVFIFVGRLVKDKGLEELVDAFLAINQSHPQTRLLLVGPFEHERDPLSADCLQHITTNEAIITTGFQKDVRPYLAVSNALVFPSYREGFPNVPMQAGCFELPSIVTNINGCNEIIEDGTNGLIIPTKDTLALKNAMTQLIEDKVLYSKLKDNARKMIVERYEQTYFWSLLLQEYQEQLKVHGVI